MASSNGSTSGRLQTAQLLDLAGETDRSVTERTLEYWRHQGLLPRPERSGQNGKRPVWDYPSETGDQLRALLRLRQQSKDPNVLRAALWYDGYPIETPRVRDSINTYLHQLRDICEKELTKRAGTTDDPAARWQAIQAVSRVMAGRRAKGFPRLGRQALAERSTGIALTLGLLLGDEEAMRHLEADAPAVERLIGVDRGRRFRPNGAGPWLDGPPEEGLASFANMGSLDRLITVVDSASDKELEIARNLARTLLGGISAFSRIADAFDGRDNASGMAGMRMLDDDPHAALIVVPLVLSILSSTELAQNLAQILTALQSNVLPLEQQARELAALPEEQRAERLKNLSQLPFVEQVRIKRLVVEFSGGSEPADTPYSE
jgi:DNA-binding transcriptional MerR regulator